MRVRPSVRRTAEWSPPPRESAFGAETRAGWVVIVMRLAVPRRVKKALQDALYGDRSQTVLLARDIPNPLDPASQSPIEFSAGRAPPNDTASLRQTQELGDGPIRPDTHRCLPGPKLRSVPRRPRLF